MELVRRHRVISFFVLAYVLTWATLPFGTFFAPGALLAALVIVFLTTVSPVSEPSAPG